MGIIEIFADEFDPGMNFRQKNYIRISVYLQSIFFGFMVRYHGCFSPRDNQDDVFMNEQSNDAQMQEIEKIVEQHSAKKSNLIPILQDVQERWGYISETAIDQIAKALRFSENTIYGVTTFYAQFRFNKPGKHIIRACSGTACHVRGGHRILQRIGRQLEISPDETTEDGLFSLEKVACMGCCALAPVMVVDSEVFGSCTPVKVDEIITGYNMEEE